MTTMIIYGPRGQAVQLLADRGLIYSDPETGDPVYDENGSVVRKRGGFYIEPYGNGEFETQARAMKGEAPVSVVQGKNFAFDATPKWLEEGCTAEKLVEIKETVTVTPKPPEPWAIPEEDRPEVDLTPYEVETSRFEQVVVGTYARNQGGKAVFALADGQSVEVGDTLQVYVPRKAAPGEAYMLHFVGEAEAADRMPEEDVDQDMDDQGMTPEEKKEAKKNPLAYSQAARWVGRHSTKEKWQGLQIWVLDDPEYAGVAFLDHAEAFQWQLDNGIVPHKIL